MKRLILLATCLLPAFLPAQTFTHADSLRGGITPERAWWDATHYDLHVRFDYEKLSLSGWNTITYKTLKPGKQVMQLDLMHPLVMDSILLDGQQLRWRQDGNAYFIPLPKKQKKEQSNKITAYYHGQPPVAQNPPWDGGAIFKKDAQGRPWMSVTCQGVGPSIWFPNKDHQYDEPDSAAIHITAPPALTAVANGRLRKKTDNADGSTTTTWAVSSPINNYNLIPYVGHYAHFSDNFQGEKGNLSLDFWVMDYNLDQAKERFLAETPKMLRCFEHWFGPFPFYEDGYKLVESPHLGMEHQSAIAYGNGFQNGYRGRDLSESGWGLKWDFILVHESGHEWFGNNISTKDLADMWVHEGFTNYSETLYTGCEHGEEAASAYNIGCRKLISNTSPIIAKYGVNKESNDADMYYKGGSLIHTLRQVIADDEKFRQILRGMNRDFAKLTVTSKQVERYFSEKAGRDFSKVFDQYLRGTQLPELECKLEQNPQTKAWTLSHRWTNCVPGFDLPLRISLAGEQHWIYPKDGWQKEDFTFKNQTGEVKPVVDKNFYVRVK